MTTVQSNVHSPVPPLNVHPVGEHILDKTPVTFVQAIERLAEIPQRKTGGFTFLASKGEERFLSWEEMRIEVRRRASVLKSWGVRRGDRVAVVAVDPRDFVLSFLSIVYAGGVAVPMYPPLSLGKLDQYVDSAARILAVSGASLLITSKQVETVLWPVMQRAPKLADIKTTEKLEELSAQADEAEATAVALEDLVFLQFTSGSTADPKGVRVTHASLFHNGCSLLSALDSNPATDMGVSWLPLYHDMGLIGFVLAPLTFSLSVTFIPTVSFIKRPTLWLDVLSAKKGTITFAPNFAYSLIEKRVSEEQLGKWDLSHLRVAGCGAEPIQSEVMLRFADKFSKAGLKRDALMPCYGMAEATLAVTFNPIMTPLVIDVIDKTVYRDDKRALPVKDGVGMNVVSCGYPFPGHEVAIVDDDGKRLADRQIGEIVFSGPSVADGYYERPDATAQTFREVGGRVWLHTGDLGYMTDGELFICGRKKDLIIIKGRNYTPQALEWVIEQVDGVRKGNVVAFSLQEEDSEVLVIALEARLDPPQRLADDVRRLLSEQFSLVPRDVVVLAPGQLPKTSSGKLQRQKTKLLYQRGELDVQGSRVVGSTASRVELASHALRSLQVKVRHRVKTLVTRVVGDRMSAN